MNIALHGCEKNGGGSGGGGGSSLGEILNLF